MVSHANKSSGRYASKKDKNLKFYLKFFNVEFSRIAYLIKESTWAVIMGEVSPTQVLKGTSR